MEAGTQTKKWICESCGFIYDPEEGDPDGGIEPGTPFDSIPDDWLIQGHANVSETRPISAVSPLGIQGGLWMVTCSATNQGWRENRCV